MYRTVLNMVNLHLSISFDIGKTQKHDFSLLKLHILEHFCKFISPTSTLNILKSSKSCDTFFEITLPQVQSKNDHIILFEIYLLSMQVRDFKKKAINLEVCSTFIFEVTKPEFIWENMFSNFSCMFLNPPKNFQFKF